ncbi:hypothetical protein RUM44_005762 [Polyplax serrata]|uniref:Myotubularin phosphatase domain-containing protein n=1 Tax=Polyplax serrata TaxID=468196 RepID=A0ABR1AXZ9_POLSC
MKNFLDRTSDCRATTNSFKFYVSASQDLQELNKSLDEVSFQKPKPKLLDGEIIITEGNRVLYFPNVSDKTKGLSGNLYVTNFRFIFDAYEDDCSNEDVNLHQINHLLGDHSSCLTNISSLYQLFGEKKKKLYQDSQLTEKIRGLQVVCKNMKVFTFNFDHSPIIQGRNIAKTLLHHAFPGRHQLLFAYDYGSILKSDKYSEGVVLFSKRSEWENELIRTCPMSASSWRISSQNQKFQMCTSFPQWLVVPYSLLDCDLVTASQSFRGNRPPIWTWSSPNGAALIRTANLLPTITDRTQENRMLENIRKCHPLLKGPCIKDLDRELPSVSELFQCYSKLRDLCIPDSHRQFKMQDTHLYSALENTKWLHHVSSCLRIAVEAAQEIQLGLTTVVQESDGRDTSALISSLVQLILDSHRRSIVGFQSLIQKEWVALGHPFCKRLGLLGSNGSEQSPVFLLFLDCVWQLQNQFPSSFEFTETYLTTLWDSVHVSIFDTFLFDCEKDRADATLFSDNDVELFFNPLYAFDELQDLSLGDGDGPRKLNTPIFPEYGLPYLGLWTQCYFRWLPMLSIRCGGRPQIDVVHRQLMADVQSLLSEIRRKTKMKLGDCVFGGINNSKNIGYLIYSDASTCNRQESDVAGKKNYDLSKLTEVELRNRHFTCKDIAVFKNKDCIDNFFPFTISSTISVGLTNSSNTSEFDAPSVCNVTD